MRAKWSIKTPSAGYRVYVREGIANTPAKIYLSEDATEPVTTLPQIITDQTGKVEFWVDSADYDFDQLFWIEIRNPEGGITFSKLVDIFSMKNYTRRQFVGVFSKLTEGDNALNKLDGSLLSTGDVAIVIEGGNNYLMEYISGATDPENPPYVIAPAVNPTGRWFLRPIGDSDMVDGFHASQNPSANMIPVLDGDGVLNLPFTQVPIKVNGQDLMSRTFYVDQVNGDDSNDGSESAPFKTIQKAINSVPVGGRVDVYIIGNYTLNEHVGISNKVVVIHVSDDSFLKTTWYQIGSYNSLYGFRLQGLSAIEFWMKSGAKIILDDEGFDTSLPQSSYCYLIQKNSSVLGFVRVTNVGGGTKPVIELSGSDSSPAFMSHGSGHTSEALVLHLYSVNIVKSGNALLSGGQGVFFLRVDSVDIYDGSGNELGWTDVISGIVRDANGVPRNVLSNTVL